MTDFYKDKVFGHYTPDTPGWASNWDAIRDTNPALYSEIETPRPFFPFLGMQVFCGYGKTCVLKYGRFMEYLHRSNIKNEKSGR